MLTSETVHRYPRLLIWTIELFCAILVLLAIVNFGALMLRFLWSIFGLDLTLTMWIPFLPDIVGWIQGLARNTTVTGLTSLLPALAWMALALLLAIVLRNAFPVVRTSSRGLLVEFTGDWLPIPWEGLHTIKVTTDVTGERYVLLVQTHGPRLTGWHRLYSLIYALGMTRGFWITSNISEFEQLVRTVVTESERTARAEEHVKAVRLDESAQSPLFRLLLSPTSFFSSRAPEDEALAAGQSATVSPGVSDGSVSGTYPLRISAILTWSGVLLIVLMAWRYLTYWFQFLVLEIPALRQNGFLLNSLSATAQNDLQTYYATSPMPFFGTPALPSLPAPFWLLVAAHVMVVLVLGIVAVVRNVLPMLEARAEGLAIRVQSGLLSANKTWRVVPWEGITTVKATEFSEESQVILLQIQDKYLPFSYRLNSFFYDGSFVPGIFVTSAMSNFEAVMQQILLEVLRLQDAREEAAEARGLRPPPAMIQQEAQSWLLRMLFKPAMTIQALVEWVCAETEGRQLDSAQIRSAAGRMFWIALLPALFLLFNLVLVQSSTPGFGVLIGVAMLWIISMLEWPLVSLLSMLLDDSTGGGEEGYRALYIYPTVQLPRLLPMLGALILLLVGLPVLSVLGWMGAIGFSVFLSAGLWEKLYNWKGSQLVLGGLVPAIWQFLVLFAYVLVQR